MPKIRVILVRMPYRKLSLFPEDQTPWFESPGETRRKTEWARQRPARLEWVKHRIQTSLPELERQCVTRHYFERQTFRAIGLALGIHASTANRAVWRGIQLLRQAARAEGLLTGKQR